VNQLHFGDNLEVLRKHVKDESVDLIYLDPPFNSKATYNILYRSPVGADAQRKAFEDTWRWEDGAEDAMESVRQTDLSIFKVLQSLQGFLGQSDLMAYLAMMAVRLVELRRVLKPTGSLYLHCDPNASHYLKVVLDGVFGPDSFRTDISWRAERSQRWRPRSEAIWQRSRHHLLLFQVAAVDLELALHALRRRIRPQLLSSYRGRNRQEV
jgi:adenine specific DNA methylase Mod